MDLDRLEEMLKTEWPQERGRAQDLPAGLAPRRPLKPAVRVRTGTRRSFGNAVHLRVAGVGVALVLVLVAGAMLSGAWLHLQTTATSSPTASATATASSRATGSPSASPSSRAVIVGTKRRNSADFTTNVAWDLQEPLVTTPGSDAGARITTDVEALLDARLKTLGDQVVKARSDQGSQLLTSTTVIASASPASDKSAGFVTVRIDYEIVGNPWPDARPPQWVDVLSYDFKTGRRISVSDLFTDPQAALQRLSAAAATDGTIAQWTAPSYAPELAPTPENFAMWAPTPKGLQVTFAAGQVGAAAAGPLTFGVPWSALRDLVKPDSYLAWYLGESAPAQTPGTFRSVGSLLSVDPSDQSVLLKDGRVLVLGAFTAAIYDPATDTIDAIHSPLVRWGPSVTVLQDGRVLVAGGYSAGDGKETYSSAELYDPRTGKWTATGSMKTSRAVSSGTLLNDGRVLIAGGVNDATGELASAEIYDPRTGRFTPSGSMTAPRSNDTATLLDDGRVLIASGGVKSAELYDPKTGRFSAAGSMTTARVDGTATLLSDGRVLFTGGAASYTGAAAASFASAELFDPRTATFTATGPMAVARSGQAAALLPDGRVLVAGGGDLDPNDPTGPFLVYASAETYDPTAGAFSPTGSMTVARSGSGMWALPLGDGSVFVVGWAKTDLDETSADRYQP